MTPLQVEALYSARWAELETALDQLDRQKAKRNPFDAVPVGGIKPKPTDAARVAALYRIEVDGWSADDAVAEMKHFGYHGYYEDLIAFVRGYKPRGFAPSAGK